MTFQPILGEIDQLLSCRRWQLHRCYRNGDIRLHYYVTDDQNRVLTPTLNRRRIGLTLAELLEWVDRCGDMELSDGILSIWNQMRDGSPNL